MPIVTRTCVVCGKEFQWMDCAANRAKNGGRFCSRQCKGIASRLPLCTCEICGKGFQPTYQQHRFCSPQCGEKSKSQKRKTGKECTCDICGKQFYVPKGRSKEARFCSKKCANEWQGRGKIEFVCKVCGKRYKLSPSRAAATNPTYCSIECRNKDPDMRKRLLAINAKQQKISPNKLEIAGYEILDSIKVKYLKQELLFKKFLVDAFIPECNIIVQFDGDYWHGNPEKFPNPSARQSRRALLDKSQDAYMHKCGLSILRFWGSTIRKHPDIVQTKIETAIKEAHAVSAPQ